MAGFATANKVGIGRHCRNFHEATHRTITFHRNDRALSHGIRRRCVRQIKASTRNDTQLLSRFADLST